MSLVCLDTHVLIWAIKKEAVHGQEDMISRATALIDRLEMSGKRLLIPTIVMGEFLIKIPPDALQATIDHLNSSFMIAPYDALAAIHYARLQRLWDSTGARSGEPFEGKTRHELKADRMIVATAVAAGAQRIYSHDKALRAFAEGYIEVFDIPVTIEQGDFFNHINR